MRVADGEQSLREQHLEIDSGRLKTVCWVAPINHQWCGHLDWCARAWRPRKARLIRQGFARLGSVWVGKLELERVLVLASLLSSRKLVATSLGRLIIKRSCAQINHTHQRAGTIYRLEAPIGRAQGHDWLKWGRPRLAGANLLRVVWICRKGGQLWHGTKFDPLPSISKRLTDKQELHRLHSSLSLPGQRLRRLSIG